MYQKDVQAEDLHCSSTLFSVAGASLLITAVTEVGVVSILFTCMMWMWMLFVCLYFSLSCKVARVVASPAVVVYTSSAVRMCYSMLLCGAAGG